MQEKNKSVALFDLNGTLTTVSDVHKFSNIFF